MFGIAIYNCLYLDGRRRWFEQFLTLGEGLELRVQSVNPGVQTGAAHHLYPERGGKEDDVAFFFNSWNPGKGKLLKLQDLKERH